DGSRGGGGRRHHRSRGRGADGACGNAVDSRAALWRRNDRLAVAQHRDRRAGGDGRRRQLFAGETSGESQSIGSPAVGVASHSQPRSTALIDALAVGRFPIEFWPTTTVRTALGTHTDLALEN